MQAKKMLPLGVKPRPDAWIQPMPWDGKASSTGLYGKVDSRTSTARETLRSGRRSRLLSWCPLHGRQIGLSFAGNVWRRCESHLVWLLVGLEVRGYPTQAELWHGRGRRRQKNSGQSSLSGSACLPTDSFGWLQTAWVAQDGFASHFAQRLMLNIGVGKVLLSSYSICELGRLAGALLATRQSHRV